MNEEKKMDKTEGEARSSGGTWEEDRKEVPEFVATRHELERLAVYWWTERIEHDLWWVVYQQTGGRERHWSHFIDRRLNLLDEILGPPAMARLFEDAAASFRRRAGLTDEDWRVLTEGTAEEQEVAPQARSQRSRRTS